MSIDRPMQVALEAALAAVTLAAVVGMQRLFVGTGWLGPLVVNALAAHAMAAWCRRRGWNLAVTAGAMAVGAVLVATWTLYWSTTAAGLPTGATEAAMRTDLGTAWDLYQDVVAPTGATTGFVLASAAAVWLMAYVADWAAFRVWVPFEATLPAATLFLFTALLGQPAGRGWAVGLYAAAVVAFLLLHRLVRHGAAAHWVAEGRGRGQRTLLTAGAALGVVAVVAGTVLGPSVPGAGSAGVIDPRSLRDDPGARVTISPLVDIKSRLVDQSAMELFRVRSSEPSYWRLTSLDAFDGRIWSSSGRYANVDEELPSSVDARVGLQLLDQTYDITNLAAIWLPSAYEPRAIETGNVDVLYDDDSATLIVDRTKSTSDGVGYRITSASPRITPADLAGTGGGVPARITRRFTALPDDFSPRVRELAEQLTANSTSPYEAALALQGHLRTFTYDLSVTSGHSGDALEQFLFTVQRGYCEQFAGAYAAMARSIGLPARVAVGFTPGEVDDEDPTLYHVRGEHAHAWPEVYLAGAGWVSFEPTPGRGMPFAQDYTGVAPAQAVTGRPEESEEATPTTAPGPADTLPTVPTGERPDAGRLDTQPAPGLEDTSTERSLLARYVLGPLTVLAILLAAGAVTYVIAVPVALAVRRWRRRRSAHSPVERVEVAWVEAVESAGLVGYREDPADTFPERAQHMAFLLASGEGAAASRSLAHVLEGATYSADEPGPEAVDRAEQASATITDQARASSTRWARLARWLDARPLLGSTSSRARRHRRITGTAHADLERERALVGASGGR